MLKNQKKKKDEILTKPFHLSARNQWAIDITGNWDLLLQTFGKEKEKNRDRGLNGGSEKRAWTSGP